MFRWPIRFTEATYQLRFVCDAVAETLTFPVTGSLDPTTDYWMGGGGDTDLLLMLAACIEDHSEVTTVSVTLNAEWHVLIDPVVASGDIQIAGSHVQNTLDLAVFGFVDDADTDTDEDCESPNMPQGLCFPGQPCRSDTRPRYSIVGGLSRTVSGRVFGSRVALPFRDRNLSWRLLTEDACLIEHSPATAPTSSIEYMYVHALSLGRPVHYLEDETDAGTYVTLRLAPPLRDPLTRNEEWVVRWDAAFNFVQEDSVVDEGLVNVTALEFDGTGDYLTGADLAAFDAVASFTYSAWIRCDAGTTYQSLFSKTTFAAGGNQLEIAKVGTSDVVACYVPATTNDTTTRGTGAIALNEAGDFNHVCVVYNGAGGSNATRLLVYIDGVADSLTFTGTIPATLTSGVTAPVRVGSYSGSGSYFNGHQDEVAFWTGHAASPAQVLELYNAGVPSDLDDYSGGAPLIWLRGDGDTLPTVINHGTDANNFTASGNVALSATVP